MHASLFLLIWHKVCVWTRMCVAELRILFRLITHSVLHIAWLGTTGKMEFSFVVLSGSSSFGHNFLVGLNYGSNKNRVHHANSQWAQPTLLRSFIVLLQPHQLLFRVFGILFIFMLTANDGWIKADENRCTNAHRWKPTRASERRRGGEGTRRQHTQSQRHTYPTRWTDECERQWFSTIFHPNRSQLNSLVKLTTEWLQNIKKSA